MMMITALLFSAGATAEPVTTSVKVECNWGTFTMEAIADGFPQGPHSADPAGDGIGGADQPRKGLGNAVEQGNLQATCEFIKSQM